MRIFALSLIFLAGCTLSPKYCEPEVCLPSHFEREVGETRWGELAQWWEQFDDPLLTCLIEEAIMGNFDLQTALLRVEELRAEYRIDRSLIFPQIEGNLAALRSRRSQNLSADVIETTGTPVEILPNDFAGSLIDNFYQVGFDVAWELDFFGKNRETAKAAYYTYQASCDNALFAMVTVASEVARRYIEIRSFQQQIGVQTSLIKETEDLLQLAKSRYQAGLASYIDVTRAIDDLEARKGELPLIESNYYEAIHALAFLLGSPPEGYAQKFEEEPGIIPFARGRIPAGLPSELLCRRPDIRQAERELAAANALIGVARANLFPSFSMTGSFGVQSNILDILFQWPSRFWIIGPSMVWNLFTGGRLLAQIEVANKQHEQAIVKYEATIYQALAEVEDRLVGYAKQEERVVTLEDKITAASLKRDLWLDQYDAGLISLDEVLRSTNELYQTQGDLIDAVEVWMVQLISLYKALGGGWECTASP